MRDVLTVLTDLTILAFDLLVYSRLVSLRRDTPLHRALLYGGCAAILAAYFAATCLWSWPAAVSAAAFMSVPSFLLFLALSKHRGSRFVLTFCLVDTVSLIIAFVGRYIGMLVPNSEGWSFAAVLTLCAVVLLVGWPYFRRYHRLLEAADAGWGTMAAASVLIYFAMIFFAAYPKPMVERVEYAPTWLVFALVVVACYAVFLQSVRKTQRILEQNERLAQEQRIFQLAYVDALTGLYNRAAYVERLNRLERSGETAGLCCVMLDCNRFKSINDRLGHHTGDEALQRVAQALQRTFSGEGEGLFRIGGDEFAVLLPGAEEALVRARLDRLAEELAQESAGFPARLSMASGFSFVQPGERLENAFRRADREMYRNKKQEDAGPCEMPPG